MSQPWADQPFPLVATPKDTEAFSASTVRVATEMALAHNLIVRNLNAIYLQAEGVTELSDIADFLIFCQAWVDASHLHHDAEEMYFFPDIEAFTGQKNIMSGNIEQHRAFGPGLDRFAEYVSNTPAASYSGKNLIEMIDEFGPSLTQHLKEEIPSLLELDKFGGKALEKAWKDVDAKAVGNIKDKHLLLPVGLGANDVTFEDSKHHWPPFPFFVPYLVQYYYCRRYQGSWRFSPCTIFGQPRPLQFLKSA